MERWAIMGWFWVNPHPGYGVVNLIFTRAFCGDIELEPDGVFRGTTVDCYGQAVVRGKIYPKSLEFDKEYFGSAKDSAAKGKINFLLEAAVVPTDSVGLIRICAGWKGIYRVNDEKRSRTGEAACMMYPLH